VAEIMLSPPPRCLCHDSRLMGRQEVRFMRQLIASLAATAMLALGVGSTALAQPQNADGLVVVQVGSIEITDAVDLNIAANVAAQVCGVNVGPLAIGILGQAVAVDRSDRGRTICEVGDQAVRIVNN
jgi:hypothetical protein